MSEKTYRVIRMYFDSAHKTRVIATQLTLEQAQDHCNDPETSSNTCTSEQKQDITRRYGPWFDGYESEEVER